MAKRALTGLLLLDKPAGITSNRALQQVKRLYQAKKAGHTGSLDPLATGLLPICFGDATKFSQYLLDADKAYQVTAQLGIETTTGDAEGEVVADKPVSGITEAAVEAVLQTFRGDIEQIPSMFSALKHQGKPLYYYARQGIEIERAARPVTIRELTRQQFEGDVLQLTVHCSKGTYIRTLVQDIGAALGCGAHVTALRRTQVGQFQLADAISLSALEQLVEEGNEAGLLQYLLPLQQMAQHLPVVSLTATTSFHLSRGQAVQVPNTPQQGLIQLLSQDGNFLGIGEVTWDGRIAPKRLIVIEKQPHPE